MNTDPTPDASDGVHVGTDLGPDLCEVIRFDVVDHGPDRRVLHVVGELDTIELDAGEPDGIRAKWTARGKHAHALGSTQARRAHGFRPFCVGAGPVLRFGIGGNILGRAAGRAVFKTPQQP